MPGRIGCGFHIKCPPRAHVFNAWPPATDIIWECYRNFRRWGLGWGCGALAAWLHTTLLSHALLPVHKAHSFPPCPHRSCPLDALPRRMGPGNQGLNTLKLWTQILRFSFKLLFGMYQSQQEEKVTTVEPSWSTETVEGCRWCRSYPHTHSSCWPSFPERTHSLGWRVDLLK